MLMGSRIFCLLLVLFAAVANLERGVGADRPNVVIFLADDMGYSDAGCYGG